MNSRSLIITLTLLAASMVNAKKPNFLVILGDDISASSLGCYGSPNPNTSPHIDRLAKEGIRFSNMFVSEAMCAPTRAELYTGLQPQRNGCFRNHMGTNQGTKSVVHYLRDLGYRVGLTGKKHFWPHTVYPFENVKGFVEMCATPTPEADNWQEVEAFITRDRDEPFCLFICSIHAHSPWTVGDASLWKSEEIILPEHFVDTQVTRDNYIKYLAEVREFDAQVGKAWQLLQEKKLDENTVLIVLDENGAAMPQGKWSTYDFGVRSACVMKWPASYGADFETDAIAQYCDIVPTLIDAAGGKIPEGLDGRSLLPIIKGETKTHREKAYFLFNSRVHETKGDPLFSTRAVTDGRYKMIWNLTPENMYAISYINGADFGKRRRGKDCQDIYNSWLTKMKTDENAAKIVQKIRLLPEYQLFDLDNDPAETTNLINNPEYQQKAEEFKRALSEWMKTQGDDGHLDGEGIKFADTEFAKTKK